MPNNHTNTDNSGGIMDSYIVRIYRRCRDNPDELAGLVEMVGSSERMPFKNFPELTSVLHRMLKREDERIVPLQGAGAEHKPGRLALNLVAGHKG